MSRLMKAAAVFLLLTANLSHAAFWHKPPGAPVSGYGSPEAYITDQVIETVQGRGDDGSRTWIYEPGVLKAGDKAPVVVFLHGFAALRPYVYRTHIAHLVKQGYIVIYPQFQISEGPGVSAESGLKGVVDQSVWARRAVAATQEALTSLGSKADRDHLYIYSHSLGGLIASAWQYYGGPQPARYVLAHPAFDSQAGQPAFVRALVKIDPIKWQETSHAITAPVTILHGEDDKIAPIAQSELFVAQLQTLGIPYALYKAVRDNYGNPNLSPNHCAPCDKISPIPTNVKFIGLSFEVNALDYRYYFAALDAIVAGQGEGPLSFDMGTWSNGRAVKMPQLEMVSP
jgi:alpha-beta hydrolase superfamily lysophospholipase